MVEFWVETNERTELVEVTGQIRQFLRNVPASTGFVVMYVPHTTAGVTINENADPTVVQDILADLERLVPRNQGYYRHREGNSASHTRASLVGSSVMVPFENGDMRLGTWQGVFFCEFDGPRQRRYILSVVGDQKAD